VLALLPLCLVALVPPVLTRLVGLLLRALRREPLERPLRAAGVGAALAWAGVMWAAYGVHLWLLVRTQDAGPALLLSAGAYALAWTAGLLVVAAPAGAGVREVALVGLLVTGLGPVLDRGSALAVAVLSRVLMTLGDLVWGAVGAVCTTDRQVRSRRHAAVPTLTGVDTDRHPRQELPLMRRTTTLTALLGLLSTLAVGLVAGAPAAAAEEVLERPASGAWAVEGRGWGHGRGMSQWGAQGAASLGRRRRADRQHLLPGDGPRGAAARADQGPAVGRRGARHRGGGGRRAHGHRPHHGCERRPAGRARQVARRRRRGGAAAPVAHRCHLDAVRPRRCAEPAGAGPVQRSRAGAGGLRQRHEPRLPRHGPCRADLGDLAADRRRAPARGLPARRRAARVVGVLAPRRAAGAGRRRPVLLGQQAVRVAGRGTYDICDTTACQVFGGTASYSASGARTGLEPASTTAAVRATDGVVRTSGGVPVFAEFSSSNGGWSTRGDFPYLRAAQDDWDGVLAPSVHAWKAVLRATDLERRFPAVGRLQRLRVTARDGNGPWGGRVRTVVLEGVTAAGAPTEVSTTGAGVSGARSWPGATDGLRSSWWRLVPADAPAPAPAVPALPSSLLPRSPRAPSSSPRGRRCSCSRPAARAAR
jgi:hypothetical protein